MKKFFGALLLLGLIFAGAFYAGKVRESRKSAVANVLPFEPSPYPLVNHPFVILTIGFNNGAWLEKTLGSVFRQNYPNFRVVYIDDASNDGSFDLAQDLVKGSSQMERVTLLRNEEPLGVLENLARAVGLCEPQEIVVVLGGDDWLAHEWVLSRLNQYYANPDLWMTYGQYREYPSYDVGLTKALDPKLEVRQQPFFASPLQSFYADLFQQIAPGDLGYPAAAELAYMIPMLEMAGPHAAFISDILYIANKFPRKETLEVDAVCEKAIRLARVYLPLAKRHLASEDLVAEEAPQ